MPPQLCWACSSWRHGTKGSRAAQSGLTAGEEEGALLAPGGGPPALQDAEANQSEMDPATQAWDVAERRETMETRRWQTAENWGNSALKPASSLLIPPVEDSVLLASYCQLLWNKFGLRLQVSQIINIFLELGTPELDTVLQ
ncbi:unnamed protein product [Natator depressus]